MLQDSATPKMVRNVIDGTTPPQKVVGSYEQLEDGTYNLIIGLTGDAPSAAAISQINGEELAGKEFYDYVRTVGAVLFSFNPDFSPAALYGGSWEKVTDRFLVGAGGSYALGSTGGSADAVVVEHFHMLAAANGAETGGSATGGDGTMINYSQKFYTDHVGESGVGKNIPPYIAVNIWRRVA